MQCSVNMEQGNHIPKGELRTVVMPGNIISKFLEVSRDNSENNVETLGTFGGHCQGILKRNFQSLCRAF